MNIIFLILIINFSLIFGINAHIFRSRPGYRPNFEPDYYEDYSDMNSRPVRNTYEQQIDSLNEEIDLRDSYIEELEYMINRLRNQLRERQDSPEEEDNGSRLTVRNYASSTKTTFPHDLDQHMTNNEMIDTIIPQVSARMPEANCMRSCNYLKNVQAAKDPLSQYMYLMVCAEGCRKSIKCLNENYCLPVMKENPGFFVQCVSKCEFLFNKLSILGSRHKLIQDSFEISGELFKIAPKVFKSGKCK